MAQETIFKFKPGSRIKGNAQAVGEWLEEVRATHGGLTASNVAKAAKPKDSPGHRYFTWDNRLAADRRREDEARHLMASVIVMYREDGKSTKPVHAFVAIGEKEDRYLPIMVVMGDSHSRNKLLALALAELAAFQKKYEALAELSAVFKAAEEVNRAA